MAKKWLTWVNFSVGGLTILLLLAAAVILFARPSEIIVDNTPISKPALPKGGFAMSKDAYDAIGKTVLELKFSPMTLQLPDLRRHLVYYGKNGRPDAEANRPTMHFAFTGNTIPSSVPPGEPLYILYDKKQSPSQYIFSPGNQPTAIWIEASAKGSEGIVKVSMKNENGEVLRDPAAHAQFNLPEKEYLRFGGKAWELGKWRVDGSLLARQRARWVGSDVFLQRHGGDEFQTLSGKQRVDFTEENETYSVFVGMGDCLIWENQRWKATKPGEETLKHPMMTVKKVDERLITFELWDVGGKGKVTLNLVKMQEPWTPQNIQQRFKFMGARTRSQYIFEIDKDRIYVSPQDWLLLTETGWIKLNTPEQIDDYVDRRLTGVLFVLDKVERKEDRQVFTGVMFNASRTDMQPVELAIQQGNGNSPGSVKEKKKTKVITPSDEDDDDDFDDDDELLAMPDEHYSTFSIDKP